jgi:ubiquinone/menaquinone biosynthesis C-methylase UbiE
VQEGFACSGFDSSPTAIEYARHRIGPAADLRVANFPTVPFPDAAFDLVIFERCQY